MDHSTHKIMLVAGDPSGDGHASRVVAALRRRAPGLRVFGMGGALLAAAGMEVREDLTKEALVGFWEVAKHLPAVLRRFAQCERWLDRERPDLLVLVDYPGFNLRLAEKAARRGIPVCYYIAPQVWAWHKERLVAMKRDLKKLLVIFPFEKMFFHEEGLEAVYVGNPLAETVPYPRVDPKKSRKALGVPKDASPLVAVLPGSRKSEIKRIWPVLLPSIRRLVENYPRAFFVMLKPNGLSVLDYPGLRNTDPVVFAEAPAWEARSACDLAWVKSGTSTVETALLRTPMVVFYKVAPLSAFLAKRLLSVKNVGMVNLLDRHPSVPELLQERFTPERLVVETTRLLESGQARKAQAAQFARIRRALSTPAQPSEVAAKEILKLL